jgi:hypothetical protein
MGDAAPNFPLGAAFTIRQCSKVLISEPNRQLSLCERIMLEEFNKIMYIEEICREEGEWLPY